jgi:hypothetical protein
MILRDGTVVPKIVIAIGRMEGEFASLPLPDRPQRDHNPGDIEYGNWAIRHGALRGDPRFGVWPDDDGGWHALIDLLREEYSNLTITELVAKYAPAVENDDNIYVRNMCAWIPAKPTDLVSQYL